MRKSMVRSLGATPRFVQPRGAAMDSLTLKASFDEGAAAAKADSATTTNVRDILILALVSGGGEIIQALWRSVPVRSTLYLQGHPYLPLRH